MTTYPIEQTWLVLVELLTDLKKHDIKIDSQITEDVRISKTLINFYKSNPTHPDTINELGRINDLLNSIQEKLLILCDDVDSDYDKQWLNKLLKASKGEEVYSIQESKSRFLVGRPAGFHVSRITLKKPLAEERAQEIAEYHNLIIEFEEDNIIILYGDKSNVQNGLKEMGSFFREQQEEL